MPALRACFDAYFANTDNTLPQHIRRDGTPQDWFQRAKSAHARALHDELDLKSCEDANEFYNKASSEIADAHTGRGFLYFLHRFTDLTPAEHDQRAWEFLELGASKGSAIANAAIRSQEYLLFKLRNANINVLDRNLPQNEAMTADAHQNAIFALLESLGVPADQRGGLLRSCADKIERDKAAFEVGTGSLRDHGFASTRFPKRKVLCLGSVMDSATAETTKHTRKTSLSTELPPPPKGLEWPEETYKNSSEFGRKGAGIIAYLERVWLPIMKVAKVELKTLRKVDPSAVRAIENLRKPLPDHLKFLTQREATDMKIRNLSGLVFEDSKLLNVISTRLRRGTKVPLPE